MAITEYGFAEQCAHLVREQLEHEFDLVSFHAQGLGDMAVEHQVGQGRFDGLIDLVPSAIGEYILGGNRPSGPDRLENAGIAGIPYVLAPCGFDILSSGPIARKDNGDPLWVSSKLAERKMFLQDSQRVQVRTSADEMRLVAQSRRGEAEQAPEQETREVPRADERDSPLLGRRAGRSMSRKRTEAFVEELKKQFHHEIQVSKWTRT